MIETIQPYLYTFYLVALHQSFTKAALELRISQSAVSIQIKKLENVLQIQLFHRQSRLHLNMTKEGIKLFTTCTEMFNTLKNNLTVFDKLGDETTLTVTAPSFFGTYMLLPFIGEFEKTHPKVRVNFQITDNLIDPIENNIDIALRGTTKMNRKLLYEKIYEPVMCIVAAKKYLQKNSNIKSPADLSQHRLIMRESSQAMWKLWFRTLPKSSRPKNYQTLSIDNNLTQIEAVKHGLGIGICPDFAVKQHKGTGLMVILSKYKSTLPIYACTPKMAMPRKLVGSFIEGLRNFIRWRGSNNL